MPTLILLIFMDIVMTGLLATEAAYISSIAVITETDVFTAAIVTILWFCLVVATALVWYTLRVMGQWCEFK